MLRLCSTDQQEDFMPMLISGPAISVYLAPDGLICHIPQGAIISALDQSHLHFLMSLHGKKKLEIHYSDSFKSMTHGQ